MTNLSSEPISFFHVCTLGNFFLGYDKYANSYDKRSLPVTRYPGYFFLVERAELAIGINKATRLAAKLQQSELPLIVIETKPSASEVHPNTITGTGLGVFVHGDQVKVHQLHMIEAGGSGSEDMQPIHVEQAIALAYQHIETVHQNSFASLSPRTISVLPVAKGCQAKCSFCFSAASISDDIAQNPIPLERMVSVLDQAKEQDAQRAVITGGGEPGLLVFNRLLDLVRQCSERFSKTVMITNGYFLANAADPNAMLIELGQAGLAVLSISRHHHDAANAAQIMGLDTDFQRIAQAHSKAAETVPKLRLVCVLQRSGVNDIASLAAYIDWAAQNNVSEICFKELYIASSVESSYYDHKANRWSADNQVPLSLVTDYAQKQGWNTCHTLPWGSPVYQFSLNNQLMRVAAYTEPSVGWELSNKLCRSWNLMADGRCFSSLETLRSEVLVA